MHLHSTSIWKKQAEYKIWRKGKLINIFSSLYLLGCIHPQIKYPTLIWLDEVELIKNPVIILGVHQMSIFVLNSWKPKHSHNEFEKPLIIMCTFFFVQKLLGWDTELFWYSVIYLFARVFGYNQQPFWHTRSMMQKCTSHWKVSTMQKYFSHFTAPQYLIVKATPLKYEYIIGIK